jgi:DNA replication regulator SLD3
MLTVKPYPSSVSKPRTLQPLMLLPRSQLPLSSLDIVSSAKTLGQSRLFETHVKILELEDRMGSQPMVLIARLDDARTLCAVERESCGLYALCQLGSWINLQGLKAAAVVSKQDLHKLSERGLPRSAIPQGGEAVPLVTPESSKYSKKKRLAIEAIQSMVKRPSTSLATESQEPPIELESTTSLQPTEKATVPPPQEEVVTQLTASEIFENVRTQYFEALYLSKASFIFKMSSQFTKSLGFISILCQRTSFTCSGCISS